METQQETFTVKSAYHVAVNSIMDEKGTTSVGSEGKDLWNPIWDLNVLGKVKNFIWKTNTNSLSTRQNLAMKKVLDEGLCLICKLKKETVIHTF